MPSTLGNNSKMFTTLPTMANRKKNQVMPIRQKPGKLQAYLVLQLKKLTRTRKKAVGRVEEGSLTVFFVKQVDTLPPSAGQ